MKNSHVTIALMMVFSGLITECSSQLQPASPSAADQFRRLIIIERNNRQVEAEAKKKTATSAHDARNGSQHRRR